MSAAQRWYLLKALSAAGAPSVCLLVMVHILQSLTPVTTAVAMAALVERVSLNATRFTQVAVALGMYAIVLAVSHVLEAVSAPLQYVVKTRIDGANRAEVARLAAAETIETLERPNVQQLIRLARAEPGNWTERSVGDGALAQLVMVTGMVGVTASCLVLARLAWWLVPLVLLPAVLNSLIRSRHALEFFHEWRRGASAGLHADAWSRLLISPEASKEVRIFGFARLATAQMRGHVLRMLEPVWQSAVRSLRQQWSKFVLIAGGLGAAYTVAVVDAVEGRGSVALETAVFAAGWAIYQGFYGYDPRAVIGALPGVTALAELRAVAAPARTSMGRASAQDDAGRVLPAALAAPAVPQRPPLVRFERIGFRYPGTDGAVLDSVDLEIRPGELLAVVGLNGAGKSTLIKLLSGLYRPTCGRITADGTDIEDLGMTAWRRQLSVVFQDFAKYHLSLTDNIALGQADAPRDRRVLEAVAREAGLTTLISRLPEGWDTPLARSRRGGVDLSGGQWQQVVLARTLFAARSGATVLVLDEPTTHLDVRTEFEVFRRLVERRDAVSTVLISHRLSTVRFCDRIVLLDGGRITEAGSHDELMTLGGEYARLFKIQAERFAAGYDDRAEEETS
ncbi:ABC transporter ATP-binding protein [Streptomyces sp. NPDC001401]|uniref:ABC transporter ATP-binding protein n=1 Tax=Streptomyces sp. NPDC001401 TaxID=3364570 RepID=UPI0036854D7D